MNNLRIPLDSNNQPFWTKEFRELWKKPRWEFVSPPVPMSSTESVRVVCPCCNAEPSLFPPRENFEPTQLTLTSVLFTVPGPTGRCIQSFYAAQCPVCDTVAWTYGTMSFTYWTVSELADLNKAMKTKTSVTAQTG